MDTKEVSKIINAKLGENPALTIEVNAINHSPHPYTIGPAHIAHASENHGGRLGDETCRAVQCAHREDRKGCTVPYEDHISEYAACVILTRDTTEEEIRSLLIATKLDEHKDVQGFVFVKSEFEPFKTYQNDTDRL